MRNPVLLYHGTCSGRIGAFDPEHAGGGDANSGLGVFFCERPMDVLRYVTADGTAETALPGSQVLVVEASIDRAVLVSAASDFFGTDEHGNQVRHRDDFSRVRRRLLTEGYGAVCTEGGTFDDDGAGVWVLLDPSMAAIVGSMTPREAEDDDTRSDYADVDIVSGCLFDDDVGQSMRP